MAKDKTSGMKSAYELALERLEKEGIDRPREGSLSDATRQEIAEARRVAESRLAEVEILYRDKQGPVPDPQAEDNYRRDRQRIEDDRDRKIEKLRQSG